MSSHTLHHADCLDLLSSMPDCSVDAVVTDPPYGLAFMGKRWDYDVPSVEIWAQCLRVLKPGGHLLAFAGTRTQHRMAVRIEDAGFEIRDMIAWVYGSGFPKSHNLDGNWEGWGTALKPALEPITLARKPFPGTVAANVLEHGTGALNVDGCRVGTDGATKRGGQAEYPRNDDGTENRSTCWARTGNAIVSVPLGRWPANLIHDGSDDVVMLFPVGESPQPRKTKRSPDSGTRTGYGTFAGQEEVVIGFGDSGSAARFFYTPKATKAERQGVTHPTVKPLDLMAYLCRLITPPGGIVLDPFMGSGTTIKAAISEGFNAIGIERDPQYFAMAEHRMNGAQLGLPLTTS